MIRFKLTHYPIPACRPHLEPERLEFPAAPAVLEPDHIEQRFLGVLAAGIAGAGRVLAKLFLLRGVDALRAELDDERIAVVDAGGFGRDFGFMKGPLPWQCRPGRCRRFLRAEPGIAEVAADIRAGIGRATMPAVAPGTVGIGG